MIAIEDLKAGIRDAESSLDQHHSHTGKKDGQHDFVDSKVPSTLCCFHLLLPHRVTLSKCSLRLWTIFFSRYNYLTIYTMHLSTELLTLFPLLVAKSANN